jgi:Icc protein
MPLHYASPLSRREFLTRTLAGGVAVFTARLGLGAAASEERWALLSDTHITADPAQTARNINMAEHLRLAVAEVKALATAGVRQVIVNGDCSYDHGEPGDYSTFIELTRPLVESGMALHCLMGNHDEREVFWNAFRAEQARTQPVQGKHISVIESGLVNWFLLDSLERTKQTSGSLGAEQIQWLAKALDDRAEKPALVMVHHDAQGRADGKKTGLMDYEALLEILKPRRHVKALIYGHTHTWKLGEVDGIHMVNLPAVAYAFTPTEVTGWVDCKLRRDGMRLELSGFDKANPMHGNVRELAWRS